MCKFKKVKILNNNETILNTKINIPTICKITLKLKLCVH